MVLNRALGLSFTKRLTIACNIARRARTTPATTRMSYACVKPTPSMSGRFRPRQIHPALPRAVASFHRSSEAGLREVKHALLRTLPGRAIVIGLTIKVAVQLLRLAAGALPAAVDVFDTVASIAVLAGGGYFVVRGMAFLKRRLLWRVRRKLIISYIFIGFVPAILIVAFFLLGGVLLFSNFSSYLVQTRFRALTERAASIASTTAVEIQRAGGRDMAAILARREAALASEFPGVSFAVVPMNRPCATRGRRGAHRPAASPSPMATAGAWSHVDPPATSPTG